jgi:CO/xanthine dehydrogenase Mo-binding subunit
MALRFVGIPTARVEGREKVTGSLRYAADGDIPGMLWGRSLRSPHAHAKIVSVDASRASAMPGVHAVITGAEHPILIGRVLKDTPVLATTKVRFIGDRVAAVAAESVQIAEAALAVIDVEYEVLPAVFESLDALTQGAPKVHDDPTSYVGAYVNDEAPALPNICSFVHTSDGDLDDGWQRADRVIEHTFSTQAEHHGYMETHACVVSAYAEGGAEIWASNKGPFMLRGQLAQALGVEAANIVIHPTPVGGDFGGKGSPMDAPVAYLLSLASGRPVKMVMSYSEELQAGTVRHPSIITIRSGVTTDGTLTAMQVEAYFNGGAYGGAKAVPTNNVHGIEQAASCYRIPAMDIKSFVAYTNNIPSGHMRAPGGPQTTFAVESHLNLIAQEIGMDAALFRMKNLLQTGDTASTGEQWGTIKAKETLKAALDEIGWDTPKPANVGRGVAMYERGPVGGDSSCSLILHPDATLTLQLPVPDAGQGVNTAMQQMVAERLNIDRSFITVEAVATSDLTFDIGSSGSRTTFAVGAAVMDAVDQLVARLGEVTEGGYSPEAAKRLTDDEGGSVTIKVHKKVPFAPDPPGTTFSALAAEVYVDPETGEATVLRIVSANDVGQVINPLAHRGQIEGGTIFGMGMAMMSEHAIIEGHPVALNLADYKIPCIKDIPRFDSVLLPRDEGPGPFNAGSIGEAANVPAPAAIANAVHDAIGTHLCALPVSAERIYAALHPTI